MAGGERVDAAGVDHTQPLFKQVLGMKPSLYDRWVHTQPMKGSPRYATLTPAP